MTLKQLIKKRIAEVFALDVAGMLLAMVVILVLGILGKDTMTGLVIFAFFAGSFFARMIFAPMEQRPYFGLKYMSDEEMEESE